MSEALFSPFWYRVATLAPRLRSHVQLHRHQYRGQTWYVLQDRSNERFHRFSPAAYSFIGLMDGQRTVQDIWELASTKLGDDAPTQPEVVQLLSQLHAADVLQCDIPPDIAELLHRHERTQQKKWQRRLMSIFAWQFPLFDPERLLQTFVSLVRPFFGWGGALLWLCIVIPAVLIVGVNSKYNSFADAIAAAKIATGAITATKFAAGAIDAAAIAADAIAAAKIATGAITNAKFAAGAIDAAAIAGDAITAAKIADGAIDAATFAANAITATAIASDAITAAKIATDAITAAKIADGAIDAATFAAGAINAAAFAANAISAAKLDPDVTTELQAGLATAADVAALPTAQEIEDEVLDALLSGHAGVGSVGAGISAAGSAGDPWLTALPGAYGAGTAGKIIGDNINATVEAELRKQR